jgi:DNA-binding NarL/FixJ family response regulator
MLPRVLLVDDHTLVRSALASLLRTSCNICGEAENGLEAVDKVVELKPDLVLLDLSMPVMEGTTAAREIRRVSPATKIVFLSIHESETIVELTRLAGADACLSKRCRAADLRKAIAAVLKGPYEPPSSARGNRTRHKPTLRLLDPT